MFLFHLLGFFVSFEKIQRREGNAIKISKQERVLIAAALVLVAILVAYHVFYSQQLKPPVIVYQPAASSEQASFSSPLADENSSFFPGTSSQQATPEDGLPSFQSINPNTADLQTLCLLPGIGETIGGRIIEYREIYGPFQKLSDLKKVKGIGDKIFAKIEPYLTLS